MELRDYITAAAGVIAIYGAGLSTYVALRDRANVVISLHNKPVLLDSGLVAGVLTIKAANQSRRPVRIETLTLHFGSGVRWSPLSTKRCPFPRKLEEGDALAAYLPLRSLQEMAQTPKPLGGILKAVTFTAEDGRVFRKGFGRWSRWNRLLHGHLVEPLSARDEVIVRGGSRYEVPGEGLQVIG